MKKSIFVKISLVLMLFCWSCTTNSADKIEGNEGLGNYFKDIHNINLNEVDDNIFYITPLSGCDFCVKQNLYNVSKIKSKNVKVVLIGSPKNPEIEEIFQTIDNKYDGDFLFDRKEKINFYETGYLKPLLVHVKNGEIDYLLKIEDDKIDFALEYINQGQVNS